MSTIKGSITSLLGDVKDFAVDELEDLVDEAKSDTSVFIRNLGEMSEEFVRMRAEGELTNDELKELLEDLVDLNKMHALKLKVQAKAKAEKIATGIRNLLIDGLLKLI